MSFDLRYRWYRSWSKLLHFFNLHYAPEFGPIMPDGTYQRWCKWCGLRMSYHKFDVITKQIRSVGGKPLEEDNA